MGKQPLACLSLHWSREELRWRDREEGSAERHMRIYIERLRRHKIPFRSNRGRKRQNLILAVF